MSLVQEETREENMLKIHHFLRESYSAVSRHIQDGVSFFKEELQQIYLQTEQCVNTMLLPVNNFLKDMTEIDREFEQAGSGRPDSAAGNIVPIEIALLSPMEENY